MANKDKSKPSSHRIRLHAVEGDHVPMDLEIKKREDGFFQLTATADLEDLFDTSRPKYEKELNLFLGGKKCHFTRNELERTKYVFKRDLTEDELAQPFELRYGSAVLAKVIFNNKESRFDKITDSSIKPLQMFETRILENHRAPGIPFDRSKLAGFDPETHAPLTDLHTHLSAQISARDLFEIASEHGALYPVELLEKLAVDIPDDRYPMKSVLFHPCRSEGLKCEQAEQMVEAVKLSDLNDAAKRKLIQKFAIPIDRVYTFTELEAEMYRYRNPLGKNPDIIEPIILKIAENYAAEGVKYAELAVTSGTNPEWLARAIPALEKAREQYGVDMRLLAGIFRDAPPDKMLAEIEKVKKVACLPHIAGIDFLGYEQSATDNFRWAIGKIGQWLQEQKRTSAHPDIYENFVVRIHAGETGKQIGNVVQAMRAARDYGIKLRIGHGINIDKTDDFKKLARELSAKGLIVVEFNPDSNIALNNVFLPEQIPVREWRELGVPCVISTDGAGAYQTSQSQGTVAMIHAGMSLDDLAATRQHEEHYIATQQAIFEAKQRDFDAKEPDGLENALQRRQTDFRNMVFSVKGRLPEGIKNKTPVLIAGASGTSWEAVSEHVRNEARIGIHMLVKLLDPEKMFFCVGRIKNEGVTSILDEAISALNASDRQQTPFSMLGLITEDVKGLPENISYIYQLSEQTKIASEMIDFMRDTNGHSFFIGGANFSQDFIRHSMKQKASFSIMTNAAGASERAAKITNEDHHFFDAISMVQQMIAHHPGVLKDGVDLSAEGLAALYEQTKTEVASNDRKRRLSTEKEPLQIAK